MPCPDRLQYLVQTLLPMRNKKNDAEVDNLFQKAAIRKCSYDKMLFVSNLLLLPKKSGES